MFTTLKAKTPTLVETTAELRNNVLAFDADARAVAGKKSDAAKALANGCSHAVEWVAFEDNPGRYVVAFSKYAGYNGLTPLVYDQLRQTHLTGTDTKRRVEKLGGTYYPVGADAGLTSTHPAVEAVKAICKMLGKTPKCTAKVRVFTGDDRPAVIDILVAAIRAANLRDQELDALFAEVRAVTRANRASLGHFRSTERPFGSTAKVCKELHQSRYEAAVVRSDAPPVAAEAVFRPSSVRAARS